ncbi:TPA: hypothetical protein DCZ39_06600 [Patescibacteria group bacterium]|nr:hypothetical protein [Candidatus Gracilibacteria bacterium]
MCKNKDFIIGMSLDEFDYIEQFLFMIHSKISVMNLIYCHSFTYFDEFIRRDMISDDRLHLIVHSGRKSIGLFYILELSSDFFDITDKSHIKHSINLI